LFSLSDFLTGRRILALLALLFFHGYKNHVEISTIFLFGLFPQVLFEIWFCFLNYGVISSGTFEKGQTFVVFLVI